MNCRQQLLGTDSKMQAWQREKSSFYMNITYRLLTVECKASHSLTTIGENITSRIRQNDDAWFMSCARAPSETKPASIACSRKASSFCLYPNNSCSFI